MKTQNKKETNKSSGQEIGSKYLRLLITNRSILPHYTKKYVDQLNKKEKKI